MARNAKLTECFFVSDLHGQIERYRKLFTAIGDETPDAVFIGGDILPNGVALANGTQSPSVDFIREFLLPELENLKTTLKDRYPHIFLIMGNDDGRLEEPTIIELTARGYWNYIHNRHASLGQFEMYGYAFIPPSPLLLKDWERYDVSRFIDPGAVSPEAGYRSVPKTASEVRYRTMANDLEVLTANHDLDKAVFLFHSPPYKTNLDRAALDGKMVEYVPLDVHIGSIAIRRFIEKRQPLLTLHGHVHESARLTGNWRDRIGRTICLTAAHDGPELALAKFSLEKVEKAERLLL